MEVAAWGESRMTADDRVSDNPCLLIPTSTRFRVGLHCLPVL